MRKLFISAFILLIALLFAYPAAADGALSPEELVDTLFSTDSERYMKGHYIIADTMRSLTDVQIASIIYEEIDGVKSAAADIWNFITGNTDDYLEMAVVELLLGEFTTGDGTQKARESKIKGLLDFMNILDTAWSIDHPEPDYKIVHESIHQVVIKLGNGQEVDDALIDDVFKKIGDLDKTFFDRTKDVFTAANCVSAVFTSIEIGNNSRVELTNLFEAAAMLNTLESEYRTIISKLRSNASKAGRNDLVKAINAVETLALSGGKWSYAKFKEYGSEVLQDTTEFFFKVLVDNLGAKWVLNITGKKLAQTYFASAALAYKVGTFVCNAVFDSSAVARVYAQLEALSELEQSGAQVLKDARNTLLSSPTYENAKLFHTAMRMQQQIELDAVDLFIELCRIFNENGFKQMFGDVDYAEYIQEYQSIRTRLAAKKCCGYFDDRAESKCKENLNYSVSGGEVTITGCKNKDFTSLRIPDTIDGYPVTKISSKAFYQHAKLTSIELPDIKKIDDYAFFNCSSLKNVNFPSSLTHLGKHAFQLTAITDAVIPNAVTAIPDYLFSGCSKLASIRLPDGITSIGEGAFIDAVITDIVLPSKITKISAFMFSGCSSLQSISIPDGVTEVGSSAFKDCSSLAHISLPDGLLTIGGYAFQNCSYLKQLSLPDSLQSINGSAAFRWTGLTSLIIPDAVASIGPYTFSNCTELESITLPQGLQSIGSNAFTDTGLKAIDIPDSVSNIGINAFASSDKLISVHLPESLCVIPNAAFLNCTSLKNIDFPQNLTSIADDAFVCCTALQNVTLPENLLSIGNHAFHYCISLKNVNIPNGVTNIGEHAFDDCETLESVVLPKNLSVLSPYAFAACHALKNVDIPDTVKEIGSYAFAWCYELKSVDFPAALKSIGEAAFFSCYALKEINLPQGLTSISDWAFDTCTSLETVTLPNSLTSIPNKVFQHCTALKSAILPGSIASYGVNVFSIDHESPNLTNIEYIYTPKGSASAAYFEANHPSVYVVSPEEPALILPSSLKELKDEALASSGVTTLALPHGMERIGARAFADCTLLTQITIPSSVKTIAQNAFDGCTDRLVIFTQPDSAAESFSAEHDIICITQ